MAAVVEDADEVFGFLELAELRSVAGYFGLDITDVAVEVHVAVLLGEDVDAALEGESSANRV